MTIEPGHPAPDFKLYDHTKQEVTLGSLRGKKILLLFFPLAFTSVCTAELCSIRDNLEIYNGLDSLVFGISVDSPQVLARFRRDQGLNFTLLSDFNKEASRSYGAIYDIFPPGLKGVSKRSAFVIDREGIIQYAEVLDNAGKQPDFVKIRTILDSFP